MAEFDRFGWEHDGVPLTGYFARPAGGASPAPAVIAFPGATGGRRRLEMTVTGLAERGYLAAAVSMYDSRIDTSEEAGAGAEFMALQSTPDRLRARARGWLDTFAALPGVDPARVATLGYCFGGQCVLEIARSGADVRATVAYHALLRTHAPARAGAVRGLVSAWCAGVDPYAPPEDTVAFAREMEGAGVRHQIMTFSDAQHAFTDPRCRRPRAGGHRLRRDGRGGVVGGDAGDPGAMLGKVSEAGVARRATPAGSAQGAWFGRDGRPVCSAQSSINPS